MSARFALAAAALTAATVASAKPVAWYHFDECPAGTRTVGGSGAFTNSVAPGTLTANAWLQNSASNTVDKVINTVMQFSYASSGAMAAYAYCLPKYDNAFPTGVSWIDPVTGKSGDNNVGVFMHSNVGDGSGYYGSAALVTDDNALHVEHITAECFIKVALENGKTSLANWTHLLVMRNADQAFPAFSTKNIKAWGMIVNTSGNLVVQLQKPNSDISDIDNDYSTSFTTSGSNLADGKWHHVAFTYDGEYLRVYTDYVLKGSVAWTKGIYYGTPSKNRLCIGTADASYYGKWQGYIDEVRISDEALPPEKFLRSAETSGIAGSDADTAVYIPCDTLSAVDDMFFFNSACSTNAAKINMQFSSYSSGIWPRLDTGDAVVVSNQLHAGILATNTIADTGCWTYTNNFTYAGKARNIWIDDSSRNGDEHLITTGDFTMECWINVPEGYGASRRIFFGNVGTNDLPSYAVWLEGTKWLYCRLLSQTNYETYKGASTIPSTAYNDWYTPLDNVVDGKWHHIALVVDRTHQKARFYLDKSLVLDREMSNFVLATDLGTKSTNHKYLKIGDGGDGNNSVAIQNMSIDEIRITRRALDTSEFITRGPAGGPIDPTRFWLGCENADLTVLPHPEDTPAGYASESGSVRFADNAPGKDLRDGARNLIRDSNEKSLEFSDGGYAIFPRNVLLENGMTEQTVEFFVKAGAGTAAANATFARLCDAAAPSAGAGTVWSVGYGSTASSLAVKIGSETATFPVSGLDDGSWHHLAVTFAASGDSDTTVTAYRDHQTLGSAQTVTGRIRQGDFETSSLALGEGYTGRIDELRISRGVLGVDEMIHAERTGLAVFFK